MLIDLVGRGLVFFFRRTLDSSHVRNLVLLDLFENAFEGWNFTQWGLRVYQLVVDENTNSYFSLHFQFI